MKIKSLFFLLIMIVSGLLYGEERGISLSAQQLAQNIQVGRQYLLLIGIDRYDNWMPLKNPVKDAKEVRDILTSRYYIDEVIELYDEQATRANIIRTFMDLQSKLEIHDSLLIYYAGHGDFNRATSSGSWIPVNAGTDEIDKTNWIQNNELVGLISNMEASHICLISDSCFSGEIITSIRGKVPNPANIPYFREAYKLTSRQVLTSGSSETVPDDSEFSLQLKMALKKNSDPFVDPLMLYNQIRLGMSDTLPLLGSLKGTGHQDGASFILFLKDAPVKEWGYLNISVKTGGKLYINEEYRSEISEGGSIDLSFAPGEYTVKMVYTDGEMEAGLVEVKPGSKAEVGFAWVKPEKEPIAEAAEIAIADPGEKVLPPDPAKPEVKPGRLQENYLTTGAGFGLNIPIGDAADIAELGYRPLVFFSYNLVYDWGVIGLGFVSGTGMEATKTEIEPAYSLYAIPVAISLRYTTHWGLPFYGFASVTGGVNVNVYDYASGEIGAVVLPVPFAEPVAGLGYCFTPGFGVSLFGGFPVVFFRNSALMGIAAGVMIEINF